MDLRTPRMCRAPWLAAAALTAAAVVPSLAGAGAISAPTCHGLPATLAAHSGNVVGTSGRDVIVLTGPATVHAGRGADVICGSPGADRIVAGPGDDVVVGRQGDDVLVGSPGRDHLYGEQGRDLLDGGPGTDVLMGGSGHDRVRAGRRHAGPNATPHEDQAQGADQVVPGTDAVSIAIAPGTRYQFWVMGVYGEWVPQSNATSPMIGELAPPAPIGPLPPAAMTISFPPQVGAFWLWPGDGGLGSPTAGETISPQSQVSFPVGSTGVNTPDGMLWAGSSPGDPNTLLGSFNMGNFALAGFTQGVSQDGGPVSQQPVNVMNVTGGLPFSVPRPTQLVVSVAVASQFGGLANAWTVGLGGGVGLATTVDFSQPGEVVALAYNRDTGFSQD